MYNIKNKSLTIFLILWRFICRWNV